MKFVYSALKAFYAAAVTALTGLATVLVDGQTISDVSTAQWATLAGATLVAFGAVFGVTNSTQK